MRRTAVCGKAPGKRRAAAGPFPGLARAASRERVPASRTGPGRLARPGPRPVGAASGVLVDEAPDRAVALLAVRAVVEREADPAEEDREHDPRDELDEEHVAGPRERRGVFVQQEDADD